MVRRRETRFVYQTADTFILVNALDAYLQRHSSTGSLPGRRFVDSYDYLVEKVLKPLNIAPEVHSTRRTRDANQINSGTAFGGMGMWWTADAMLKIAKLLSIDGGRIDGAQVLEPSVVAGDHAARPRRPRH